MSRLCLDWSFQAWLGETAYFIHKFIESMEGIHNSKVPGLCLVRGARYLDGIFACEHLGGGRRGKGGRSEGKKKWWREGGREREIEGGE